MPQALTSPQASVGDDWSSSQLQKSWIRVPLIGLAYVCTYFLAAKLGIATSLPPEGIVILWPANAVVLVFLLSAPSRNWWLFFLLTLGTEVYADVPAYPLAAALGYATVNFSEAALTAALLQRFGATGLSTVKSFAVYLAAGPVLAAGVAALAGAAIYKMGAPDLSYAHYWRVFWLGDALGLLVIGTALLAWRGGEIRSMFTDRARVAEALILSTALGGILLWIFSGRLPNVYLLFPVLLWSAVRFGRRGASAAVLVVAAAAVWGTINGFGPFLRLSRIETVLELQALLAVITISSLTIAFTTDEAKLLARSLLLQVRHRETAEASLQRAYQDLEHANLELDRRVAARTQELQLALARNVMLLKEVHHRVKNNLQLLSSMVRLNGRSVADPAARQAFSDLNGQIGAIAEVYDQIHQLEQSETVDFSKLLEQLTQRISVSYGTRVDISSEASGRALIRSDLAVGLSLSLNELITNSAKHGRGDRTCIKVTSRCDTGNVVLSVADNGPGFPADFDLHRAKGFGMRMTRELVSQAGGHFRVVPVERGATVEIAIPLTA